MGKHRKRCVNAIAEKIGVDADIEGNAPLLRSTFTYDGGDHAIFVGEVMKFDHDPKGKPLVFWRGGYHRTVS